MRDDIGRWLEGTVVDEPEGLYRLINTIAPYIDGWSLSSPMTATDFRRLASARVRAGEYREFSIPKRSGGERIISAPSPILKAVQSALNLILQTMFTPSVHATGFVVGRSIRDNALMHIGQMCMLNIDIENFFPSITRGMLRRALRRELGHKLRSDAVIETVCSLCTVPDGEGREVLPQGAPTSPVLSNIVLKPLDEEMGRLARRFSCRYSRYADDMTFSHSRPVRRFLPGMLKAIEEVVKRYGLRINEGKTVVQSAGERMEVTGIIVSEKTNVRRVYVKQLRVLLHLWEKRGYAEAQTIFTRDFAGGDKHLANVIEGKINYLRMIKGGYDPTYRRLKARYTVLRKQLRGQPPD